MKKICLILIASTVLIASQCFAQEIDDKPFLDFDEQAKAEYDAVYRKVSDTAIAIWDLANELYKKGEYKTAYDALLLSESFFGSLTNELTEYQGTRWTISQYKERSDSAVDQLMFTISLDPSRMSWLENDAKRIISESSNSKLKALAEDIYSALDVFDDYFNVELKKLTTFKALHPKY